MSDGLGDPKPPLQFEQIRQGLLMVTGFDIGNYKPHQMMRLLNTVMSRAGAKDFHAYLHMLRLEPERIQDFKNYITINVSEFFRDKALFQFLNDAVLPDLIQIHRRIHVWSAGCAGGEEAYTLAILLEEKSAERAFDYQITASDIDSEALQIARDGIYADKALKNVPPDLFEKYFDTVKENFQVRQRLKSKIKFEERDLLKPAPSERFNLILCRNVVIYFTEKSKEKVYRNLTGALATGGILFIGSTENLFTYRQFGLEKVETYFYRKAVVKPD